MPRGCRCRGGIRKWGFIDSWEMNTCGNMDFGRSRRFPRTSPFRRLVEIAFRGKRKRAKCKIAKFRKSTFLHVFIFGRNGLAKSPTANHGNGKMDNLAKIDIFALSHPAGETGAPFWGKSEFSTPPPPSKVTDRPSWHLAWEITPPEISQKLKRSLKPK